MKRIMLSLAFLGVGMLYSSEKKEHPKLVLELPKLTLQGEGDAPMAPCLNVKEGESAFEGRDFKLAADKINSKPGASGSVWGKIFGKREKKKNKI